MFLGHFWSFIDRDFFQKLCHTQLYMSPYCHAKFQKKTNVPILRKLTDRQKDGKKDGQKDGQKDGRTLFYRTLLAEARGPSILYLLILL